MRESFYLYTILTKQMDYLKELETKLKAIIEYFKQEISGIRSNRPSTMLVENIKVDYMGSPLAIKQLGSIGIEAPRDILVTPWDPGSLQAIEKAINDVGAGLSVSISGNSVRCKLPAMTEERANELIKLAKSLGEASRIKIRTLRDDINKASKAIASEDEKFRTKEGVQKQVDAANKLIDSMVEAKMREIKE